MLMKRGTLIDATIIEAQARRPQSESGARSGTDPGAAWTRKGKRSHFGYKMHIGMDAGSGLVRSPRSAIFFRKRLIVEWSGTASVSLSSANRRNDSRSWSASSMPTSDASYHCWRTMILTIVIGG